MEKLKLITQAVAIGISEADVLDAMAESSLIDFNLDHLKEIVNERNKEKEAARDAVNKENNDSPAKAEESQVTAAETIEDQEQEKE